MVNSASGSAGRTPSTESVRAQVATLVLSETFARSERFSKFLQFIVCETLAGRGEFLKEQVIARAVYGRTSDANAHDDPVVRVDARRLRDKLREYYSTSPDDPVLITLPKGGYVPEFEPNDLRRMRGTVVMPSVGTTSGRETIAWILLVVCVAGLVASTWSSPKHHVGSLHRARVALVSPVGLSLADLRTSGLRWFLRMGRNLPLWLQSRVTRQ